MFLTQARLRFHFIIGQVSLGRFLLPCSPWLLQWTNAGLQGDGSPRAGGLPNAGACLSCVVRERQQMGWGFPVTVPQCVHRGPNDFCSKSVCKTAALVSPSQPNMWERESGPAHFRATLCPRALKKSYSSKAETLYSNTWSGAVIFPQRLRC